jgi:hypothetical protein
MRKSHGTSIGLALLAVLLAFSSVPGCSGDPTVVVEGDPEVRRKNKADALEKTLYPNGKPAASTKKKGPMR